MNILPSQVASETRVDDSTALVQVLKTFGAKAPKIVLVFDSNEGEADAAETPWKVRVFYHSPTPLEITNLNVPVVLMDTKIMPTGQEVIRTTYPEGYLEWCGVINGQPIWLP